MFKGYMEVELRSYFSFETMLDFVKSGKKVTRSSWFGKKYLFTKSGVLYIKTDREDEKERLVVASDLLSWLKCDDFYVLDDLIELGNIKYGQTFKYNDKLYSRLYAHNDVHISLCKINGDYALLPNSTKVELVKKD